MLERQELSQQERDFLAHYSFTGSKREALDKAGFDVSTKDKVYHRASTILRKAQHCSAWQDALARHELTYDELAARLRELVYASDSRTAVQALKLAMQSADLLREKSPQHPATQIIIHTGPAEQHAADTPGTSQPIVITGRSMPA